MSKNLYISTFPLGVLKILKNLRVFCYKYNVKKFIWVLGCVFGGACLRVKDNKCLQPCHLF